METGKMMGSEAITYEGKVFTFFSTNKKMVFKLGKKYDTVESSIEIAGFSTFKSNRPFSGWFEVLFQKSKIGRNSLKTH
ncbi:MAG: hypothetical protein NWS46_10325 [Cyclobacteriaceae bacterium]|nr:hypothetical protein [Cyclobacteriaceae bacterium]